MGLFLRGNPPCLVGGTESSCALLFPAAEETPPIWLPSKQRSLEVTEAELGVFVPRASVSPLWLHLGLVKRSIAGL